MGPAESPGGPTAQERQLKQRCDELERGSAALRDRLGICESRMKELTRRDNLLSGEVRQLQLTKAQLELQIELLSKVPVERDEQKARADRLAAELQALQKRLDALGPTTRPATRPGP